MSITVKDASGVDRTVATTDDLIPIVNLIGTRTYNYAGIQRVAVATTATNSAAITATEIMVSASVKCYILLVAGTGTVTGATASTAIPIEAGEKFHLRITSGQRISVIRDTTDGFLHIIPVA